MLKKLFLSFVVAIVCFHSAIAQEYFTISNYNVDIKVNKDASLDVAETISVHYLVSRHGIMRFIPYKYSIQPLPEGLERADRQLESGNETRTIIEDIKVDNWKYKVSTEGNYKVIKIGSENKYVDGDQVYTIRYRILNAINFFDNFSEFYFNVIGDKWGTIIDKVEFSISLPQALADTPEYFVATGHFGSTENYTQSRWINNTILSGVTTRPLRNYEGLTVGIRLPKDFLSKPDYRFRGILWLLLPVAVLAIAFYVWKRWGKDEEVVIQTEFYPPENISPSISGFIIDDRLHRRDLTALVPYWGAAGYLRVEEIEDTALFGLIKNKEYQFVKLKDLPPSAMSFEKTLFNGIFNTGDKVMLDDLKNVLYKSMNQATTQLKTEVKRREYYVKGSREMGSLMMAGGLVLGVWGFFTFINDYYESIWRGVAAVISAIILLIFGFLMTKRTKKGTLLYQQLAGFKEFIKSVERDRLQEFLKQDEHYFDKILPYAIVFNIADTWKDKLDGLDIPPPTWYSGNYNNFTMGNYMRSLNQSMNSMSSTFYSSPSGSGSSGGSFGGGGSSGGGFGGGGGSSW